ncbi:MAG: hypothetical protein AAF488_18880 [Planctomycetota bacterium]
MSRADRPEFSGVPPARALVQNLAAILSGSIPGFPIAVLMGASGSGAESSGWAQAVVLVFYGFPMVVAAFSVGVIFARAAPPKTRPFLFAANCGLFFPPILPWVFALCVLLYLGGGLVAWRNARLRRPDFALVEFGSIECRTCLREAQALAPGRKLTSAPGGRCVECGRLVGEDEPTASAQ